MQRISLITKKISVGVIIIFIAGMAYRVFFYLPDLCSAMPFVDKVAIRIESVLDLSETYRNLLVEKDCGNRRVRIIITGKINGDKEGVIALEKMLSRECKALNVPLRVSEFREKRCFWILRDLLAMDSVVVEMRTIQYEKWVEETKDGLDIYALVYGKVIQTNSVTDNRVSTNHPPTNPPTRHLATEFKALRQR